MSTIAVTAAQIGLCFPSQCEVFNGVLAEAAAQGQVMYQTTSGTFGLCDTGETAQDEPRGIALEAGAAGQAVSIIKRGAIYGVTLTGEAYDSLVYASNTAGEISDSVVAEIVGRVIGLADNDKTKILFVTCDQESDYN